MQVVRFSDTLPVAGCVIMKSLEAGGWRLEAGGWRLERGGLSSFCQRGRVGCALVRPEFLSNFKFTTGALVNHCGS